MDFWVISTLIGWIGWGLTLYIYSRKFKNLVDSGIEKTKSGVNKVKDLADKDNRKIED